MSGVLAGVSLLCTLAVLVPLLIMWSFVFNLVVEYYSYIVVMVSCH